MEFLLFICVLLGFYWLYLLLTNPDKAEYYQKQIVESFSSPKNFQKLFTEPFSSTNHNSQKLVVIDLINQKNYMRLSEVIAQGFPLYEIYDNFASLKQLEGGASFAKTINDSRGYAWFMKEILLQQLSKNKMEEALYTAEQVPLHREAYSLFVKLNPSERWLKRGDLALKIHNYQDAFEAFYKGNEIREATKAAAALNSMELLIKLAKDRSGPTIKVLILDTLEELKKDDLRKALIEYLQALKKETEI